MYRLAITTNTIKIMKKIAFLAAAVFCSSVTFAQEAPVTAPVVAPASNAEVIVDQMLAKLVEMVDVLESVEDRATADAAAEKITAIKAEVEALTVQAEALGELDEATQQAIAGKMMGVLFSIAPRIEEAGARIEENAFYGSEALEAVINEM